MAGVASLEPASLMMIAQGIKMIIAIAILLTSFYWLMLETSWLSVRLPTGKCNNDKWTDDYGWSNPYHDSEFIDLELDYNASSDMLAYNLNELAYAEWNDKRHEPKIIYGGLPAPAFSDYPQYKWLDTEERLARRRNGECLYQRGKW